MPISMESRSVTFVVKTSKLCNLRCRYCYEMADLAKRDRMSPDQIRSMFRNVVDYYTAADARDRARTKVTFVWHGGEPLLTEPSFYWDVFADQAEIFGDRLARENIVQTNLTVLDDERLRLLRDGFDGVGVSLDLFGQLRVNTGGRDLQDRVLRNLDRLRAEQIPFGCITVLHRGNIDQVDRIWRFYERAGISFRALPLFQGATEEQNTPFALTGAEIGAAMCRLVDLWLASDSPVQILPIGEQIRALLTHLNPDAPRNYYDKREWCWAVLVNTDGSCFTDGDPYGNPEWALGNIFTDPLGDIFAGAAFERSALETDKRIAANCLSCPFFGACSGRPIGDTADNMYEFVDGIGVCQIDRTVLGHLQHRLANSNLISSDGRFVPLPAEQSEFAG
jgi:uncharacterized protein